MDVLVSTAEPFVTTAQAPNALRVALGTGPLESLKSGLQKVGEAVSLETRLHRGQSDQGMRASSSNHSTKVCVSGPWARRPRQIQ